MLPVYTVKPARAGAGESVFYQLASVSGAAALHRLSRLTSRCADWWTIGFGKEMTVEEASPLRVPRGSHSMGSEPRANRSGRARCGPSKARNAFWIRARAGNCVGYFLSGDRRRT
jgi:hypothetical protein